MARRRILLLCAASSCAVSGFLLPGGLRALLLPRAVDWCRATWTEIQVETDERADEMIMDVWPGASDGSRARKRSPSLKDVRARLEAVAAWPEEPRLQHQEHYDESQAVESLILKLAREAGALRQQGKVQAGAEIMQRVEQLLEERDALERKHHELLGNHQGLLRMKDREARLPPGTTSRLERAYRAPPPTDVELRKGWKNSIVSLPTAAAATAEDTATAAEAAPEVNIPPIWLSNGTPIALASRLLASASLRTFSCALLVIAHTAAAEDIAMAADQES